MRLNRRPESHPVGDVVRSIEEDLAIIGCLGQEAFCQIQGPCVLRRALREATNAFLAVLDKYTLADLLTPQNALIRLLGRGPSVIRKSEPGPARTAYLCRINSSFQVAIAM